MTGLVIRLLESNYANRVERIRFPSWHQIEVAIRSLVRQSGRIDIWEQADDGRVIMVAGSPGVYAIDVLIDDKNAAMLVSKCKTRDSVVEVFDEEYNESEVVFDLDSVIEVVKRMIETSEFVSAADMEWRFRAL